MPYPFVLTHCPRNLNRVPGPTGGAWVIGRIRCGNHADCARQCSCESVRSDLAPYLPLRLRCGNRTSPSGSGGRMNTFSSAIELFWLTAEQRSRRRGERANDEPAQVCEQQCYILVENGCSQPKIPMLLQG